MEKLERLLTLGHPKFRQEGRFRDAGCVSSKLECILFLPYLLLSLLIVPPSRVATSEVQKSRTSIMEPFLCGLCFLNKSGSFSLYWPGQAQFLSWRCCGYAVGMVRVEIASSCHLDRGAGLCSQAKALGQGEATVFAFLLEAWAVRARHKVTLPLSD